MRPVFVSFRIHRRQGLRRYEPQESVRLSCVRLSPPRASSITHIHLPSSGCWTAVWGRAPAPMAPLPLMLMATCFACSWDARGYLEFVARSTALTLLLGWPLAPSLLRGLRRFIPRKSSAAAGLSAVGRSPQALRTLFYHSWVLAAGSVANRLHHVLTIVPDGLANIPHPSWRLKLGLLSAAMATALPLALSTAIGLAAFLRFAEITGRVAALAVLLGWPLGPSLHAAFQSSAVFQPGRFGRLRRHLFCERVPPRSVAGASCPICWEEFASDDDLRSLAKVDFCQWGCGAPVHAECMRAWNEGRAAHGSSPGGCCLCRAQWA